MSDWTPDLASVPLEEAMEAQGLLEEDRDELRRFAEVLERVAARRKGEKLPPAPEGMRGWLTGEDVL